MSPLERQQVLRARCHRRVDVVTLPAHLVGEAWRSGRRNLFTAFPNPTVVVVCMNPSWEGECSGVLRKCMCLCVCVQMQCGEEGEQ